MSDENQNPKSIDDGSDEDIDIESLSSDEKAAFEKIMAEIAAAESANAGKASPTEPESHDEAPESTNSIDTISSSEAEKANASDHTEETDEASLTDDQQAALDQIMAEIESKNNAVKTPPTDDVTPDEDDSGDELDADQQAALDQIMAEINAKKGPEEIADTDADGSADDNNPGDDLDADQQAALDQIMAEINAKKGPAEKADTNGDRSEDDDAEDELDENQQAALDQILAEINAKKKDANYEEEPESDSTEDTADSGGDDHGLSLEEFNNELSLLLSPKSDTTPESPAVEEPAPSVSAKTIDATEPSDSGVAPIPKGPTDSDKVAGTNDYPILKEVDADEAEEPEEPKKKAKAKTRTLRKATSPQWVKKVTYAIGFVALAASLMAGGYWIYNAKLRDLVAGNDKQLKLVVPTEGPETIAAIPQQAMPPVAQQPEPQKAPVSQPTVIINNNAQTSPLQSLESELSTGCSTIQAKISEVDDLIAYYNKGIAEETNALESAVQSAHYTTFKEATNDPKVELSIRAIQRRQIYVTKLARPLAQLHRSYEELLYLQRYAHLNDLLGKYTSGVAVSDFEQKASHALRIHLEKIGGLTVDHIEIEKPSLESIWNTVIKKAVHPVVKSKPSRPQDPLNAGIAREICEGDFSRKYLITELSTATAACLIKWSGRDLYLNELKELPPSIAKILAQWPGEWLSLNGLKELSPESAHYLASWPGKRLSLNGVIRLSSKATTNLSKWKGDQLEMIGLEQIGPWKNYGTRLFLSENLKRRLEGN